MPAVRRWDAHQSTSTIRHQGELSTVVWESWGGVYSFLQRPRPHHRPQRGFALFWAYSAEGDPEEIPTPDLHRVGWPYQWYVKREPATKITTPCSTLFKWWWDVQCPIDRASTHNLPYPCWQHRVKESDGRKAKPPIALALLATWWTQRQPGIEPHFSHPLSSPSTTNRGYWGPFHYQVPKGLHSQSGIINSRRVYWGPSINCVLI